MRTFASGLLAFFVFSTCLSAAQLKGKVTDPSGAAVAGAQISIVSRTGVAAQTVSSESGAFTVEAPDGLDAKLVVTAPGFAAKTLAIGVGALNVALDIAPVSETVQVIGSALDVPLSEQGSSVSVITAGEIRERNEPFASDLLRYLPGMTFNQNGSAGAISSLFLRGGNPNSTLVQIDGFPVNAFGGVFDFAHLPSQAIEQVSVARGAQSAIYGSYANSGVIDFETRRGGAPALELLAEGGTYRERRFGVTGSAMIAGFGFSASASRYDDNGPVVNSDYRDEGLTLNVSRRFRRQSLFLHGDFLSNSVGEPGPWGSDPKDTFFGIDTISRSKNNTGDYGIRYEADLSPRVREEVSASFFLANNGYRSPYGFSFNRDIREQGEARTIVSVSRNYTLAIGVAAGQEEVRNTFISDAQFSVVPIPRDNVAGYIENRFVFGGRLFVNAGVRGEWLRTAAIASDGFSRPAFPENTVGAANPKVSAAYVAGSGTRLHSSFGVGLRPPSGFELAFTNNPALRPERTRSVDFGVEQRLGAVQVDATYFYNRFYDLIVPLGGTLKSLSRYSSANLSSSRAEGLELAGRARPARWLLLTGSYTLLKTRLLEAAPAPFVIGQPLTRRPDHTGSAVATFTRGRVSGDIAGYFRGKALYEEPSYGASNGLFWNPGFANVGVNLNVALGHGVTAYGHLRNALNRQYEEVFGFPSPRLNFVAGMKWSIRGRE